MFAPRRMRHAPGERDQAGENRGAVVPPKLKDTSKRSRRSRPNDPPMFAQGAPGRIEFQRPDASTQAPIAYFRAQREKATCNPGLGVVVA